MATNYANSVNATGLNLAIKNISANLEQLSWLEVIYGRAYDVKTDKNKVIPKTYLNTGEYINVLPNDTFTSQCFFRAKGSEVSVPTGSKAGRYVSTRDLSLIFWVNLENLAYSPKTDYIYPENLKKEVLEQLKKCIEVEVDNKKAFTVFDEDSRKVFDGYDLEDIKKQFLMFPFSGFRIDLTVKYIEEC